MILKKIMQNKIEFYLITCSKKDTDALSDIYPNKPLSFNKELKKYRADILEALIKATVHTRIKKSKKNQKIFNVKKCIDLEKKAKAHLLYNGRFYNAASAKCWTKEQTSKIYIISALFGIIRADDYIFNYDLKMDDTLISPNYLNGKEFTPKKFWKGKLDEIIQKLKNKAIIYNLLSNKYLGVLKDKKILEEPPLDFNKNEKYSRLTKKGNWLKEQLIQFTPTT